MRTSTNGLLLAAALISIAGAAQAQTTVSPVVVEPPRSLRVSYADLDLGVASGLRVLEGRVSWAADQLCGERSRLMDVDRQRKECRSVALASAAPQIAAARDNLLAEGPRFIVLALR